MEILGFGIVVLIFFAVFFISGVWNEKKMLRLYKEKLVNEYGTENKREWKSEEYSHVDGYFKKHIQGFYLDEITWNDLNMDDVYKQINYAKTSAGDEYLYYLLRCPNVVKQDWDGFENKVEYFKSHEKERLQLQLALHKMGYTGKYSIYDYLDNLNTLGNRNNTKELFADILLIGSLIWMFFDLGSGLMAFFVMIFYNMVAYYKEKAKVDPYITSFRYLFRILKEAEEVKKVNVSCLEKEIQELNNLRHEFDRFTRFSYLIMSGGRMNGDIMELGLDYMRMFFHLDIIKFNSMVNEVYKHRSEIDKMLTLIGALDVYLCVGEYREYLKDYCMPEYGRNKYAATKLYHPLLQNPVKNDLDVTKSMLITGSNASGKSTFLKTVALNAVLAQSVHTVCADSYVGDYYRVYSSLTLKDNIFEGDSYYMTEIKSIKRIMDAFSKDEIQVLAFVDEVLRGTNTVERISASSVILQQLADKNGYCFAATHDLELTEMLKNYYENVHFEEIIEDDDIQFPYRLLKGKATTRNAIALLKIMGYDNRITQEAKNQAERFEIKHKWEVLP